jgi:hypothetical protein
VAQDPHALHGDSLPPLLRRTCGFPASGSPGDSRHRHSQGARLALWFSFCLRRERLSGKGPRLLSGSHSPTGSSVVGSGRSKQPSRPLTPQVSGTAPSLPRHSPGSPLVWAAPTPGPSRVGGYGFPPGVGGRAPTGPGLPGSSTDLSARAVPTHPGEPDDCVCPLLRRRCWLQPIWEPGHSR